jgi:hypothetical protein
MTRMVLSLERVLVLGPLPTTLTTTRLDASITLLTMVLSSVTVVYKLEDSLSSMLSQQTCSLVWP